MHASGRVPQDREEWASLYGAYVLLRKRTHRVLSRRGLTIPQATVLALLAEAGRALSVTRLAELMSHERPSMSGVIDRMSEMGLVERLSDPRDRRLTLVNMTTEGRRLHDDVRAEAAAMSERMFGVLTTEERQTLKSLLQKFWRRNLTGPD